MRELTLHEKISIKGILFDHWGLRLPTLDMVNVLHRWKWAYAQKISAKTWYKLNSQRRSRH